MVPVVLAVKVETVGFVGSMAKVKSPKSAKRAWRLWSTRIFALTKGSQPVGPLSMVKIIPPSGPRVSLPDREDTLTRR